MCRVSREEVGTEPWEDLGSRRRARRGIARATLGVLDSVHGVTLLWRHDFLGSWRGCLGSAVGTEVNGKGLQWRGRKERGQYLESVAPKQGWGRCWSRFRLAGKETGREWAA